MKKQCTQSELDEMLTLRDLLHTERVKFNAIEKMKQREFDNGTYESDDDDDDGIEQEGEEFAPTSLSFQKINFHASNISGNTEIADCEFVECDLSSIKAQYVRFTRCTFARCNLESAKLSKCIFDTCSFIECDMTNADIGQSHFVGSGCEGIIALLDRSNNIRGARTSYDESEQYPDDIYIDDYDQTAVTSADDVASLYYNRHMTYESAEAELYRLGFRAEDGKDGGCLYDGCFSGKTCATINAESDEIEITEVDE